MNIDFSMILGLAIGCEYVHADEEQGIEYPCLLIDLLIFRLIIEFVDS